MSVRRLKQYLDKIEIGLAINYPAFYRLVEALKLDFTVSHSLFSANKVKDDKYIVTILSARLHSDLKRLAETDTRQRSSLAQQNRSHETSVGGSLLVFKQNFGHSQVIEFDRHGQFSPQITQTNKCLILENCDNFLNARSTFTFLAKNAPFDECDPIDIYYASGNAISNKLHHSLFKHYQSIYLALDLDLGGLKIANILKLMYGDDKVEFLLPIDIEARLQHVVRRRQHDYLEQVDLIGRNTPSLRPVCDLITKYGKTLEQESYIYG
ncbi:MAG: hypothetical protein CMH22_07540 [Methylophaga sp.]|nr:hypothetical protein [Methylophaga sp.]|tara:strand:- start:20145 stop:20945 length:801 start_codon:yes stop_codon:yes gene_type:complete